MRYNGLGSSDLRVSEICLGTMTWGEQNTEAEAHQQLDYALSRGINFIDAAEMYPVPPRAETQGRTEAILGDWLKQHQRDKVIVATKVAAPRPGLTWVRGGNLALDRRNIEAAIDASLKRLRTDYIDLYQVHWPDRYVPVFGQTLYDPEQERATVAIEEQLAVFADCIKAGKIRHLGVSNETPWGLCQWLRQAEQRRHPKVVSIQNAYNLINRAFEMGLSEVTRRESLPLLAYSPLAFGHLTGKYLGGVKPQAARLTRFPSFGPRYFKVNVPEAVAAYVGLAKTVGLDPATLAVAFVRSKWFVAATIIGATSMAQLTQNIDAADVVLDTTVQRAIDEIHHRYPSPAA
jgi:aryl-alcohol dehydrogenase-like predicted oxidoreductase